MKKTKEAIAAADFLENRATEILLRLFDHAQNQKNFALERTKESENAGKKTRDWVYKSLMNFGAMIAYHNAATQLGLDTTEFKFHDDCHHPVWFFVDYQTSNKANQSERMREMLTKECIWFEEFQNGKDGNFSPEEWTLPCIMHGGHVVSSLEGVKNWIEYIKKFEAPDRVKILPKQ